MHPRDARLAIGRSTEDGEYGEMIGEPRTKRPLAILGYLALIPLGVGVVMLLTSIDDIAMMRRLELSGLTATGSVAGEIRRDSRRGYIYCPIVRFKPAIGTAVQFMDRTCSKLPHKHPDGSHVLVRYLANAPAQSAAVDEGQSGYWLSAFTGLAGLLSIMLAIGMIWAMRRARRAPNAPPRIRNRSDSSA